MTAIQTLFAPSANDVAYAQEDQLKISLICRIDSYKFSHPFAYPDDVDGQQIQGMTSYGTARVDSRQIIIPAGMQMLLKRYLTQRITMEDVDAAELMRHLSPKHPIGFVICDTTPLVTSFYARKWYDYVDPWLAEVAETRKYDYLFMCRRDFPHVNDGTRIGPEFSDEQEKYYRLHAIQPFVDLGGLTGERVGDILQILSRDNLTK